MIAIFLSEWADWVQKYSRMTLVVLMAGLALIAGVTFFRPEAVLETLTFFLIWLGYRSGRQIWGGAESWAWVGRAGLSPLRSIIGKALAVAGIALFHLAMVSPIWLPMKMIWGVSWSLMAWTALSMVMAVETSAAISLWLHLLRPDNRYICGFAVSAWLLLTAIVPGVQEASPIGQVWSLIVPGGRVGSVSYWLINGSITVVLWILIGFALRKEVGYGNVLPTDL